MSKFYYGEYYQLKSPPFHITPDPALLMLTPTHQEAIAALEYAIGGGKGFAVITGEVGVGKTTILRYCLDQLDRKQTRIIYLFNPRLSTTALFAALHQELVGGGRAPDDPEATLQQLQLALLAQHEQGITIVLAIDEAQNMPEDTLEGLRMLSNLETAQEKLVQILLVGQPELNALLARRSLRQLAQRVAVWAHVERLTRRESRRYIEHRLRLSGRPSEPSLFTIAALWYLVWAAHGIPRTLNIYCDNALINGYGHDAPRITLRIARELVRPLRVRLRPAGSARLRRVATPVFGGLAAAGIALCAISVTSDYQLTKSSWPFAAPAAQGRPSDLTSAPLVPSQHLSRTKLPTGMPIAKPRAAAARTAPAVTDARLLPAAPTPAASVFPAVAVPAAGLPIAKPDTAAARTPSAPPGPRLLAAAAMPPVTVRAAETSIPSGVRAAKPSAAAPAAEPGAAGGQQPTPRPPAAEKSPAVLRLPAAEVAALMERGDTLLRLGDIASARLFYERAADAGSGQGAIRMAATFDPAVLPRVGGGSMPGDPAKADIWYARARVLGALRTPASEASIETK